jgi:Secretion system C-terminal sorting domain
MKSINLKFVIMKKIYLISLFVFGVYTLSAQDTIKVPEDYSTIIAAINAAVDNDVILVSEGTYIENINFYGKAITIASQFLIDGDTSHISRTIIDGSEPINPIYGYVVAMRSGEDTTSVLNGFTITGGTGMDFTSGLEWTGGGGVFIKNSGGKIINNIIKNNHIHTEIDGSKEGLGVGICAQLNFTNTVIIKNNTIANNIGTGRACSGGGIGILNGYAIIDGNIIKNNSIDIRLSTHGGGVYTANTSLTSNIEENMIISNNLIYGNSINSSTGSGSGGGISAGSDFDNQLLLLNNIISDNYSSRKAGGIHMLSSAQIINNTIYNNEAEENWNNLYMYLGETEQCIFINNIEWSTNIQDTSPTFEEGFGHIYAYNNILAVELINNDFVTEANNYHEAPIFIHESNFELAENSPGVGWGIDSIQIGDTWYFAPKNDCNGNCRPCLTAADHLVDIGAIESNYDATGIKNSKYKCNLQSSVYPNPFSQETNIKFELTKNEFVTLKILSIQGREITSLVKNQLLVGQYNVQFVAQDLEPGVYFYKLQIGEHNEANKMILIK